MKSSELQKNTGKLLVFDKKALFLLEKDINNLNANIKYWLKNGNLIALKNGVYLLSDKYQREGNKDGYLEYIAGQLLQPSYLSLEYVLNKYQILSEPARTLTSVSTKSNREFVNKLGAWRYSSAPKQLFTGFTIKYFKNQPVAEASKAKALFDFLYLRFRVGPVINSRRLEALRLNLENLNANDLAELKEYFSLLPAQRFQEIYKLIKEYVN
jgi:predicted transcriptional regulator of viral defense system